MNLSMSDVKREKSMKETARKSIASIRRRGERFYILLDNWMCTTLLVAFRPHYYSTMRVSRQCKPASLQF